MYIYIHIYIYIYVYIYTYVYIYIHRHRMRVSSVVEHLSTNPKFPGSIPGPGLVPGSWIMVRHVSCILLHNFPKAVGVYVR